jgi:CO/xanthine dehydrogenase FAD-binding subunit/aerobic-type carbon monoxide dehydrogenase small subunit (CoxS/CutS family)
VVKPSRFRYHCPAELEEALGLLAEYGDEARPLAGGQSLVPMLNLRLSAPAVVVDLNRLPGLDTIQESDGRLHVGTQVRQRALERADIRPGALADGLPLVGHVATRNRGTVGGSVAHADPAAELPLALLALGGSVVAAAGGRRREIAAEEFFAGFLTTTLEPGEMVVEVAFDTEGAGEGSALMEVAQRHGDFALAAVACRLRVDRDGGIAAAQVAVGAVADRPVLIPEAADALVEGGDAREAGRVAASVVEVVGSLHAPEEYRRHLVGVLVARAVERAAARAQGDSPPVRQLNPPRAGRVAELDGATHVNGRSVRIEVEPRRLLSDFLRHDLGLRGTHVGCEHGVCGACTIRLDGAAVRSCLLLAVQAKGADIQTVEGLAGDELHPLQDAFRRHFALQCGFCTSGILLSAAEFLENGQVSSETEIRELLSGHLCRCTGYEGIVAAIHEVAAR